MPTPPPDIPFLIFDAVIGRGGMSEVWRAWHRELKQFVAVKLLDAGFAASGQDVRQFMMEVRTMSSLNHPNLVRGYGADRAGGRYFFIMDLVEGYSCAALLARKKRLDESDALIIGESVASGMNYAWTNFGIVHCDIKPENIMIDRDGTVKVMDLGLCQSTACLRAGGAPSDEIIGTPAYMSPEQIYGDTDLDCRADIYCLGAALYHLATGRILFVEPTNDDILHAHVEADRQAPDPRTFNPALSQSFCRLLALMTVKDPAFRIQTWSDVLALAREPNLPLPPSPSSISLCR